MKHGDEHHFHSFEKLSLVMIGYFIDNIYNKNVHGALLSVWQDGISLSATLHSKPEHKIN